MSYLRYNIKIFLNNSEIFTGYFIVERNTNIIQQFYDTNNLNNNILITTVEQFTNTTGTHNNTVSNNLFINGRFPVGGTTISTILYLDNIYNSIMWNLWTGSSGISRLSYKNLYGNWIDLPNNLFIFQIIPLDYPCFLEGSKILCLKDNTEIYLPIETLNKGDLVKTLLNGYVPIKVIGSSVIQFNPSTVLHPKDRLFICSKQNYPELFEDLVLTGAHSILVDHITDEQKNKTIEILDNIYVTDNKYRLMACIDDRTSEYNHNTDQTIWHLALENENYYGNYGIYANGLLVESVSIRYMIEFSNMNLKN